MKTSAEKLAMPRMPNCGLTCQRRISRPKIAHASAAARKSRSPIQALPCAGASRLSKPISSRPAVESSRATTVGRAMRKPLVTAMITMVQNGMPPFTKTPACALGAKAKPQYTHSP